MNSTHLTMLIALAGVALISIALLALAGANVPDSLSNALTTILGGAFGGGVVVGADGVRQSRAAKAQRELEDKWRA